ncbi:Crp/Fnr family transcriptional regulator [Crenalkalicoccus roseus]|uniref:Crp/Fnr family transcriptional regulator n=1 Tax=Crenalkalicoccus roseus TaxID=1485588 RepID=UPI00107FE957|nr:Crp/Fnr family transcriptional regulator [Crenalkalicoccus roseus]
MEYRNRLLVALPPEEQERLRPHLEPVALRSGQTLHWRGAPMLHVHFVEEGLVSVLAPAGGRDEVEAWQVGTQGLVGLPLILGGHTCPYRHLVLIGGRAMRIPAAALRRACEARPALRHALLAHARAAMLQAAQNTVCAVRHSLRQRLARWLAQARRELGRDELGLTHAMLSHVLGARRASITTAVGELEDAGILRQRRGRILVLDREGLERAACGCHRFCCRCRHAPPTA